MQCLVAGPMDRGKTAIRLDTDLLQIWRRTDSMQQQQIKISGKSRFYGSFVNTGGNMCKYPKNKYTITQETKKNI